MRTVLLDPPAEVEAWLLRRQALGQDRFDEVWQGEYHVAPAPHFSHGDIGGQLFEALTPLARKAGLRSATAFNLGDPDDYRVPDAGFVRGRPAATFLATAAVVVEIVSPNDETWAKLGFYFDRGVEELVIVDPRTRMVQWLARGTDVFEPAPGSTLLRITSDELAAELDWPDTGV